jgi:SAM-dependent methyltransferase
MNLTNLYKKLEFEAGFNEPIQQKSKNPILRLFLVLSELLGKLPFNKYTRNHFRYEVNERIVEVPFVFQNMNLPKGSKILDFGCNRSKVCIELASLGYNVIGVDMLPYNFSHKNFEFIRGNFLDNSFPSNSFDGVTAISAIEHSGLEYYGSPFPDGDKKIVDEFFRILKPGGLAIITVPYGVKYKDDTTRIYDEETLSELLSKFKIVKEKYYLRNEEKSEWSLSTKEQLSQVCCDEKRINDGVACLVCLKEH